MAIQVLGLLPGFLDLIVFISKPPLTIESSEVENVPQSFDPGGEPGKATQGLALMNLVTGGLQPTAI